MRREEIVVVIDRDGERNKISVAALTDGGLAVHRTLRDSADPISKLLPDWGVTHMNSGLSIGHFHTRREALAVIERIRDIVDWTAVWEAEDISKEQRAAVNVAIVEEGR